MRLVQAVLNNFLYPIHNLRYSPNRAVAVGRDDDPIPDRHRAGEEPAAVCLAADHGNTVSVNKPFFCYHHSKLETFHGKKFQFVDYGFSNL